MEKLSTFWNDNGLEIMGMIAAAVVIFAVAYSGITLNKKVSSLKTSFEISQGVK